MRRPTPQCEFIRIVEKTLIVAVPRSFPHVEGDIYEAARRAWKVNLGKVQEYKLVLARRGSEVVGAFRVQKWKKATSAQKGMKPVNVQRRCEFKGEPAEDWNTYVGKQVPGKYITGSNPVRYCDPPN